MRRRDTILTVLREHEGELRELGVDGLFLFGSVARGEDEGASDVDIFFDHRHGLGLEVMSISERLNAIIAGGADVTTRRSLHPQLRDRIEAGAVRVF